MVIRQRMYLEYIRKRLDLGINGFEPFENTIKELQWLTKDEYLPRSDKS